MSLNKACSFLVPCQRKAKFQAMMAIIRKKKMHVMMTIIFRHPLVVACGCWFAQLKKNICT